MSDAPVEPEEAPPTAPAVKRRARSEAAAEAAESSAAASDAPQVKTEVLSQAPAAALGMVASLDALLAGNPDLLDQKVHAGKATEDPSVDEAANDPDLGQDFASLMAAAGPVDLKPGDRVRGTVASITESEVFVDIGGKQEAYLHKRELMDKAGNVIVEVGQDIEAQVVLVAEEGVRLSYGALQAQLLSEQLEEAAAHNMPIEGRVTAVNDGGLEVRIGTRRAFCPKSQVDRHFVDNLDNYVGKTLRFLVTRFDPTGRRVVVSRRALLESEAKQMASETRKHLEVGALLDGTVRKIMPFGVFVDLGGIDGLVHISELSWDRVEDANTVVQEGQAVRVKVLRVDGDKGRVGLSMKAAQADPWAMATERFEEGKTYPGKVTRLTEFGAFVQLEPGVEGLIHVSELDWNQRINHPQEVLQVDQEIEVALLGVDRKRKRLALSLKQAQEDPWGESIGNIKKGDNLKVAVEKVADFGVFATISEGVTGLIPNSHMDTPRGSVHARMFKPGQELQVQVIEIDRSRRKITLSRKALADGGQAEDFRAYKKELVRQDKEASASMNPFAAAFARAKSKG
jgi:small subunit ribosomal protein S1